MMPYLMLGLLVVGFGSGLFVGYDVQQSRIESLNVAIARADEKASSILIQAQAAVKAAEDEQARHNTELDKANEDNIKAINYWHDKHTARLRPANGKGCSSALPSGASAAIHKQDATDMLWDDAAVLSDWREASKCAVEKNAVLAWAKSNCGLQ